MLGLLARWCPIAMSNPLRVAVLIGGNGSNLQAMIDAKPAYFELVGVISHSPVAYGLERAKRANLPYYIIDTNKIYPNIVK